ncbi:WD40 repeat [Dillenia turbinata]|uniref:WD40 repeat n=1 Tax=Dillenia turbinata TaxID=194707 RepID=A0AAN8UBF7_9MAGN
MEFTEAYKHSGPCCFSPNSRFLAVAVDYRLVIRDIHSLKVVHLFSCVDKISFIEWALDSEYILCGLYKRPMIQAWSLTQPEWTCKIDEGPAGISYARWSPDSRHILTTSDFQLRLTVWSLVNTACIHLQWPKHAFRGVSFTRDGKFVAICTRHDCKDYINLLSCHTWEIMGAFAVLIYSPDGRCLFKYQAYESGLGIKSVSWSPCGQLLAVGSYDQVLRVLNHLTWKIFAEFTHLSTVRAPCYAAVFKEVDEPLQLDMSELCLTDDFMRGESEGHFRVRYEVMEVPITIPFQKPPADKPNPKQGVGLISWSCDSQYICTRNDSMPTVLWIWDIHHLELAAFLVQKDPIRAAAWDPTCTRLVLCTGSSHLYMWTPLGAYCVNTPLPQFCITDLKWNSNGSCLLLKDKDSFCCAAVPIMAESTDYSSDD